jgi:CubicO group peptidase (beta-lactamase class C family)
MSDSAAAARAELARLSADARAVGLFTHVAAAAGRLDDATAPFAWAELPDGREIFDLASLTKAIVTVPLVFRAVARGGMDLDATVGAWLGARASADLDERLQALSIRSLLAHQSGLPAWRNFWTCFLGCSDESALRARRVDRLVAGLNRAAAALDPQRRYAYSDVGFLLLGLVLERRGGTDLAEQFDGICRDELGLDAASLPLQYPAALSRALERCVPSAYCSVRERLLCGEVHDENCAGLGGVTGHAGIFGSAAGVARFLVALAASPSGAALLAANAAARCIPPGEPPNEPLVGWRQGGDRSASAFAEGLGMGHLGFTGTAFWVSPERRTYAILLTNRVIGGRIRPEIVAFRRAAFTALDRVVNS